MTKDCCIEQGSNREATKRCNRHKDVILQKPALLDSNDSDEAEQDCEGTALLSQNCHVQQESKCSITAALETTAL